jgi:hypothetical protein
MTGWFSRRSGSRESIHNPVRRVLRALSLSRNPMPPRITRKSDRRKVSDRTMVGTAQPLCLSALGTDRRRYESTMNLQERKTHSVSLHHWGWTARPFSRGLPVAGEVFVLTSPFIERGVIGMWLRASSGQKSCFRPASRLTADSTSVSIRGHVEVLVSHSPMPRVWQLRCTPSSRGRPIQAIRPAIGLSARLFLHELQWPILRLFSQQKERRRDRREQLTKQTFCCLLRMGDLFVANEIL